MGTIADKLNYLLDTKTSIKEAIEAQGVTVPDGTTFREYAGLISGGMGGGNLTSITITPTAEGFVQYPEEGYDGFEYVDVEGDFNLSPENVAEDITIFGVTGTAKLRVAAGSDIPSAYTDKFESAKALCDIDYVNVMILEITGYLGFGFLTENFKVTSYDSTTTEFMASGWEYISYNKATGQWTVKNHTEAASTGDNFIKHIRHSDCYIYYNDTQIYPPVDSSGSGGGGTSADSVRTETVVALEAVSKGNVVYISGGSTEFTKDEADLPATFPTGTARGVAFNPDGTRCVVAHEGSPHISIYDTTTTPWTKLSNPASLPTNTAHCVAFNPDGTRCVVGHGGATIMSIYDTTTTPWTKLDNPDTLPPNYVAGVAFNPDGTRCIVGWDKSPYIYIYDTTTTPWIKLDNPDTLPAAYVNDTAFNPDGTRCVVTTGSSFRIYDTTTTPWTRIGNPKTVPLNGVYGVAFNPSGTRCVVGHSGSPIMSIYDTTTTPWTKLDNPDVLPVDYGLDVAFNSDGTRCAVAHGGSPYINIYDTTTTPWTKLDNPNSLPAGIGHSIAFNPSGTRCVVGHEGSPYMSIYAITNGKPVARNSNNQLTTNINVCYGIATKDATANAELPVEIILDN